MIRHIEDSIDTVQTISETFYKPALCGSNVACMLLEALNGFLKKLPWTIKRDSIF